MDTPAASLDSLPIFSTSFSLPAALMADFRGHVTSLWLSFNSSPPLHPLPSRLRSWPSPGSASRLNGRTSLAGSTREKGWTPPSTPPQPAPAGSHAGVPSPSMLWHSTPGDRWNNNDRQGGHAELGAPSWPSPAPWSARRFSTATPEQEPGQLEQGLMVNEPIYGGFGPASVSACMLQPCKGPLNLCFW